jgi:hypothetical protein
MKLLRLLLPALLAATPAAAQRAALFGVYDPDSFIDGNATRFVGCHDGRQFHAVSCPMAVDTLRPGDNLPGVDAHGRFATVRVDAVRPLQGDLYEAAYGVSLQPAAGPEAQGPVLFWQPQPSVELIAGRPVTLDSAALALLRAEALRLHQRAEALRAPGERADSLVLGSPVVRAVDGEGRVSVFWPGALAYGDDRDTRPSVFFVYDPAARRIVCARFGHPEWAPLRERDAVSVIEPLLFFRVAGDGHTYFLGRSAGPWEYLGFGIYDLHTGERVLRSR